MKSYLKISSQQFKIKQKMQKLLQLVLHMPPQYLEVLEVQ